MHLSCNDMHAKSPSLISPQANVRDAETQQGFLTGASSARDSTLGIFQENVWLSTLFTGRERVGPVDWMREV
jgi:hypothetical protein